MMSMSVYLRSSRAIDGTTLMGALWCGAGPMHVMTSKEIRAE
jgi:hypothetical protein